MNHLFEKLSNYYNITLPASLPAIEAAEKFLNVVLPTDYKDFLKFTNGLEGNGPNSYLALWSAEELIALNEAYHVNEFISNIIIFGSDGAEDAFAFDTTNMSVVKLPFIGMAQIASIKLSNSFQNFLSRQIKSNKSIFKQLCK